MKDRPHVVIAMIVVDHVARVTTAVVVVVSEAVEAVEIVQPHPLQQPHQLPQPQKPEFPFNQ